jgi:hypothetical protein
VLGKGAQRRIVVAPRRGDAPAKQLTAVRVEDGYFDLGAADVDP